MVEWLECTAGVDTKDPASTQDKENIAPATTNAPESDTGALDKNKRRKGKLKRKLAGMASGRSVR